MHELFIRIDEQLPIFRIGHGENMVLYTPGYSIRIKGIPCENLKSVLRNPAEIKDVNLRSLIINLLAQARDSVNKWESQKGSPFTPECLIIHV